jgi:hypothetical protein
MQLADPDFGIADLVDDALAVLYESGIGQLLHDLIAARHICRSTRVAIESAIFRPGRRRTIAQQADRILAVIAAGYTELIE